jgi:hypothetical protein
MLGLVFLFGLVSGGSGEAQRGSSANKYSSNKIEYVYFTIKVDITEIELVSLSAA